VGTSCEAARCPPGRGRSCLLHRNHSANRATMRQAIGTRGGLLGWRIASVVSPTGERVFRIARSAIRKTHLAKTVERPRRQLFFPFCSSLKNAMLTKGKRMRKFGCRSQRQRLKSLGSLELPGCLNWYIVNHSGPCPCDLRTARAFLCVSEPVSKCKQLVTSVLALLDCSVVHKSIKRWKSSC